MAAKKKEVYEFPPESCGCCKFFENFEGEGYCLALPPHISHGADESGDSWYQRGLPCGSDDSVCIYFYFRVNA